MGSEIGGYRQYKKATCTAATHNLDLVEVRDDHKIYVTMIGTRSDRANADVEVFIVTGGQEILLRHALNLSADEGHTQKVNTWLYTSEFIRFKFGGLTSGDIVEGWAVGEDKYTGEAK
uniref:Uncharacterized protein n=1 Tax=viral metagenome TaxID=1070528 RepID=A0A6H2A1P0_9ZZZZ